MLANRQPRPRSPARLLLGAVLGSLMLALAAPAQDAPRQPPEPLLIGPRFTVDDDLSSNTITSFARTTDGYVWIGTVTGLVRSDGVKVRPISLSGSGLPTNTAIHTLFADAEDRLWLSTNDGIAVLQHGQVLPGPWQRDWPANEIVRTWTQLPDHSLLVVTFKGQILRHDGQHWQPQPAPPVNPPGISTLCTHENQTWLLFGQQLWLLENGTWQPIPPPSPGIVFSALAPARQGGLWLLSPQHITRFHRGQWQTIALQPPIAMGRTMIEDGTGRLWIATSTFGEVNPQSGLLILHPSTGQWSKPPGIPTKTSALLCAGQGAIWVGTHGDGLLLTWAREPFFRTLPIEKGLNTLTYYDTLFHPDGRILVSSPERGVFIDDHHRQFLPATAPRKGTFSLGLDSTGALWAASDTGTERWTLGQPDSPQLILPPDATKRVYAIVTMADGTVLIASQRGIHEWRNGHVIEATLPPAARDEWIRSLITQGDHAYAGGPHGLLLHRQPDGTWQHLPNDLQLDNAITGLALDSTGTLWATASSNCLFQLHHGHLRRVPILGFQERYLLAEGLTIADGKLWIGGSQQILSVTLEDARLAADGTSPAPAHYIGGKHLSGMPKLRFGGPQRSVAIDPNGIPYFATYDAGLLLVNLTGPPTPQPIRPTITSLRLGKKKLPILPGTTVDLPPGTTGVLVYANAPNTETLDPIVFRSRHTGTDWRDEPNPDILLQNLTPGPHTVEVQAKRIGTAWSTAIPTTASFTFRVQPYWWQTLWGRAVLVTTALLLILAAAHTLSQLRLRRQRQQLAHEASLLTSREQALAQSTLFRQLLNASDDCILSFDPHTQRITDANATATARLSRPGQPLIGTSLLQLGPDWAEHLTTLRSQHRLTFETTHLDQTGSLYPAEVVIRLATGTDGQLFGIAVSRDITTRQAALAQAHTLERQLQESQKLEAIGHLAGGVAHDFNNLLQVIQGCIDNARRPTGPTGPTDTHQHQLDQIALAADRAAQLTSQLLAFSRRTPVAMRPLDLRQSIPHSLKMIRRLIGTHIDVQFSAPPSLPLIHADETQLDQVLMNLAVNSRDAMPSGGTLTVTLRSHTWTDTDSPPWAKPGDWVALTVTDTGQGMDRATSDRIFDPFFTTKPVGQGTGLGLSVVYGVVQAHHGLVQIDSTPGHGTTISIYFPAIPDQEVLAQPTADTPTAPAIYRPARLLFADDDSTVRHLTTEMLTDAGHHVHSVSNGQQAIAAYQAEHGHFDLVILDIIMPELNGIAAGTHIRSLDAHIPLIFCSGYTGTDPAQTAALPQPHRILNKPYGRESLLSIIEQMLPKTYDSV